MARHPRPDFGAVVARHSSAAEDRVGRGWIAVFLFGAIFMFAVSLVFEPRAGPPRPVYYLLWLAFVAAAARSLTMRYFTTPMVLLERGIFLPAYLPRHWVRMSGRALSFAELTRVRLDATPFRSGSHLFETASGPKRCAKAYFPPAKRFAEDLKRQAPQVEIEFVDRRGARKRYAPVVTKRPRKPKTKGERADAK